MHRTLSGIALWLALGRSGLAAQAAPAAPSTTAAPPPTTQPAVQAAPTVSRAGWFSDKRPLRVGDIVTIVVDEAVNSRESQTENASKKRSQQMASTSTSVTR